MLVARELEREFKDLGKYEKEHQRIWEKGTSTRIDRAGTIRVVNGIPAFRPDYDKRGRAYRASSQSPDQFANNLHKPKVNIFEAQDPQAIKSGAA